ncbi:MAG: hypothetical protein JXN60_05925 [Lentisphaerae bacterium]|nr:hypothetical protein [Lentisphaerota bacterium]
MMTINTIKTSPNILFRKIRGFCFRPYFDIIICLLMFIFIVPVRAGDYVCMEAESALNIEYPMRVACEDGDAVSDKWPIVTGASGSCYLEIPQGSGNPPEIEKGYATIKFIVLKDATYHLWCRIWWADECGNSLTMTIDDGAPFTFGQNSTFKCWHWVKMKRRLSQLDLSKGAHVLKIINREDGVRIDQILFTDNHKHVPVGKETVTVLPAPIVVNKGNTL